MTAKASAVLANGMSEAELLATIRQACKMLRLLCYHTYRSDRSEKGFPDLVIVGPRGVLFPGAEGPEAQADHLPAAVDTGTPARRSRRRPVAAQRPVQRANHE